jgi:hypothetical protein
VVREIRAGDRCVDDDEALAVEERGEEGSGERWSLYGANQLVTGALNRLAPDALLFFLAKAELTASMAAYHLPCLCVRVINGGRAFTYVSPRYFLAPEQAHAAINQSEPGVDRVDRSDGLVSSGVLFASYDCERK